MSAQPAAASARDGMARLVAASRRDRVAVTVLLEGWDGQHRTDAPVLCGAGFTDVAATAES